LRHTLKWRGATLLLRVRQRVLVRRALDFRRLPRPVLVAPAPPFSAMTGCRLITHPASASAFPMRVFAIGIEHPDDVAVQRPLRAAAREHRRPDVRICGVKKVLSNVRASIRSGDMVIDYGTLLGWKTCLRLLIIAGWQVAYGRPNILAATIAGFLTPPQGSITNSSTRAVSVVRFAGARSMRGLAITSFSIGRSVKWIRPPLAKGGAEHA
jgi:hypothetical protein